MWPLLPQALPGLAVVVAMACLVVRFVVPVALRTLVEPARDVVTLLAALLVLPEYWVSRAHRRAGGTPPHLAYLYGHGVTRLAWLGDRGVVLTLRSLARAAVAVHPLVVGLVAAAWKLALSV
ncbi:hypothetical protein AB0J40_17305 [Amycolatopsis sp. NPDC049691]|uniref:hypothetical protein n=1 Tax=Amycolatopsis sp. NPDC049691 TaxID=3155155 RepID=UPI00343B3083